MVFVSFDHIYKDDLGSKYFFILIQIRRDKLHFNASWRITRIRLDNFWRILRIRINNKELFVENF
jgi:hypothetical protein